MSIALYMDEQVPRQITTGLRLRGVDVLTVQEDERLRDSHAEAYRLLLESRAS